MDRVYRLVGVAAFALAAAACGSSDNGGSTIPSDGGAGAAGSSGSGGAAGSGTGGTAGSGGSAGSGGGAAGAAGASCGDLGHDAKCKTCLATHCCTEAAACSGDPDCAALVACLYTCQTDGGTTCPDCTAQVTSAASNEYNALLLCNGSNCATDCRQPTP